MANENASAPIKIRILIADRDALPGQKIAEFFTGKGFQAQAVTSGSEARQIAQAWEPHVILYDLMLPDLNALSFLKYLSTEVQPKNSKFNTRTIVFSGHNDPHNIRECIRLGAVDYVSKPITHEALFQRVVLHLQNKREITEFRAKAMDDNENSLLFLHLTDITLREALKDQVPAETLYNLSCLMSLSLKAVRTSIIKCDREGRKGFVVASSDRRDINALEIDLNKYPEINYVLSTEKALAVDNLAADQTMFFVTKLEKQIAFNALLVAPIRLAGGTWGILSARMPENKKHLTDFEIRWTQIVANVAALVIHRDTPLAQLIGSTGSSNAA